MSDLKRTGFFLLFSLVVAGIAAVAWSQIAAPPRWTLSSGSLVMDEQAAGKQITVVAVFVVIGLIAGLVLGAVAQVVLDPGWVGVLLIAVVVAAAGVVAWRLGILLGPPPPNGVPGLAEGDTVPDRLTLGGYAALLAWPIGAFAGTLIGTLFNFPRQRTPA